MARTNKVNVSKQGEFKHSTSIGENGEILYDFPIEIHDEADMRNYHITDDDCKYLHFGSSEKLKVYFYRCTSTRRRIALSQKPSGSGSTTSTPAGTSIPGAWCRESVRRLCGAATRTSAVSARMVGRQKRSRQR